MSAYRRAGVASGAGPLEVVILSALKSSNLRSIALALGLAVLPSVASYVGIPVGIRLDSLFGIAVAIAVALDLREEAGWRAGGGAWTSVYPSQRVYAVEPALDALRTAGIVAVARAKRFRALFHFFAPYAPIEIFVPPDQAEEATRICGRVIAGR